MKSIKKLKLFLLIALIMLIINACAKKKEDYDSSNQKALYEASPSDSADSSGYTKDDLSDNISIPAERITILSASLDIEASDAAKLYRQLVTNGNSLGGYEFSYNIYNYDEYSTINAVFKIPPKQLNEFINFIGDNGKIINKSLNSEDITESYYDMETRLETKRKSLERYYVLLDGADTIEEIIQLQKTIDSIILEIESYEGKLKVWNSLTDMATVNIYIRQYNDPVEIRKEINWNTLTFDDMGYLIKRGLVSVINFFVSALQWLLIALIVCSPLWIIALCVLIIIRRKKKYKDKNMDINKDNNDNHTD